MNAWDVADRHVNQLLPILGVMGDRGIRVDLERLAEFNSTCDAALEAAQARFNSNADLLPLRRIHPEFGYKRTPKDLTGLELHRILLPENVEVERWARRKPFLATSSQQVLNYMRSRGHRIPFTKDGDETSGQKALLLAWRKYHDDNYRDFVEFRKIKKLRGTYGEWPLVQRVDGTYATTTFTLRPDNGRLSSVNPNVQNIPRDGDLSRSFRRCLVARPGHRLLQADLTSAEALATGWLSRDEVAMRIARLGTHKFATAKYVGFPVSVEMSDEELRPWLKRAKDENDVLYRKIKTTIFGGNYLAGPRKVFEQNPEEFESQADAAKFQKFCKSLFPKIGQWQQATIRQAQLARGLTNPFGYYKAFWDLPGGDGPSAVAFLPSSIVAAVMKEVMLQLWEMEAGRYMIWQVHDDLKFDVPEDRVEVVREQVRAVMTQPWPQLNGLQFGVEITVGDSLAD